MFVLATYRFEAWFVHHCHQCCLSIWQRTGICWGSAGRLSLRRGCDGTSRKGTKTRSLRGGNILVMTLISPRTSKGRRESGVGRGGVSDHREDQGDGSALASGGLAALGARPSLLLFPGTPSGWFSPSSGGHAPWLLLADDLSAFLVFGGSHWLTSPRLLACLGASLRGGGTLDPSPPGRNGGIRSPPSLCWSANEVVSGHPFFPFLPGCHFKRTARDRR